jgi:hypothetical protein
MYIPGGTLYSKVNKGGSDILNGETFEVLFCFEADY